MNILTGADLDKMLVAFVPGKDREHMLAKGEGRGVAQSDLVIFNRD